MNMDGSIKSRLLLENVQGKKLLILGAYSTEIEIIQAAKEMGVYSITTDNHINRGDAPAKLVSDEAWDISWSDIDHLYEKCKQEKIDGILAGFSERRITYARDLAERLNFPFYARGSELDIITNKQKFKEACIKANVRVPRSYTIGDKIDFPVIVKPCDNGGSKGITICYSEKELQEAIRKAGTSSDSNNVIIEEYLTGDEVMVYFTVHNGEATLSAMCDRRMHRFAKNITQLPVGYYYPSEHLEKFVKYNLDRYKQLLKNLLIQNGLIAFQAFIIDNDIVPYDPTYRLDGTIAYHMIKYRNGIDVLKMLISHSLTGSMGNDEEINKHENPFFSAPTFELPILLGSGRITFIQGIDKIKEMKDVVHVFISKKIGDTMHSIADFSQMFGRIHICAETDECIREDIRKIFKVLKICDEHGKDMVINRNINVLEDIFD